LDGVYTADQAVAGETEYLNRCSDVPDAKEKTSLAGRLRGSEPTPSSTVGGKTFRLQNMDSLDPPFTPDSHRGHKMQVKGAFSRQANNTLRIIVTSVEMIVPGCGQ
jgi:uncharacterized membrane protein